MLTKYTITIDGNEMPIPEECLKNWDEISFSLKRTDYSGVMRSFSTSFDFCGDIAEMLFGEYLNKGFSATAGVAVYTITNRHTWEKQFEAPLDFSSLSYEHGILSINALDNTLAALIKSKKSQKYEFPVSGFDTTPIEINRIELKSNAKFNFVYTDAQQTGVVNLRYNESQSEIISKEYVELYDEVSDLQPGMNSFFAKILETGIDLGIHLQGTVRCPFTLAYTIPGTPLYPTPVAEMKIRTIKEDPETGGNIYKDITTLVDNDLLRKRVNGVLQTAIVGGSKSSVYATLDAMKAAAGYLFPGKFGVVGTANDPTSSTYYENNVIYEWTGSQWTNRGAVKNYYQDRAVDVNTAVGRSELPVDTYVRLEITDNKYMRFMYGSLTLQWVDPVHAVFDCDGIRPESLINAIVHKFSPDTTVTIAADDAGVLANTFICCGESLRRITDAKVYTTFQDFANWIEVVFGYTYRIVGNSLEFVHRSDVFDDSAVKVIGEVRDVVYSVQDGLIYTSVDAGYPKKEYGEIDGRYEKNFTNYYDTGVSLTTNKLNLSSKYRADVYGIEFTARKSESDTTDDKADEDVFAVYATLVSGKYVYYTDNTPYAPSVCIANNGRYIAAMGNGEDVVLTMTSSDGNNALDDITVGDALFSAGEVQFSTNDMTLPADPNGMLQIEHNGFRYTGFIGEAKAKFGRVNGMDYTLIVKDITEI